LTNAGLVLTIVMSMQYAQIHTAHLHALAMMDTMVREMNAMVIFLIIATKIYIYYA